MGLLLLCKTPNGGTIPMPTCVLNDLFVICNTLLLIFLFYQLYIRVVVLKMPFKMTTIIFYIIFIQSLVYELYNGFESWICAYLSEIYIRHICFIFIMYFFSLKAWKFNDSPYKKKIISFIALSFALYFTGVLISTLVRSEKLIVCKDYFWLLLSIAGIVLSLGFAGIAFKLSRGVSRKMRHFGIYEQLNQTNVAEDIKNKNSFVRKRLEVKMENVWKIVLFMSLSHFLSYCIYIFYLLSDNSDESCPLIILENKGTDEDRLVVVHMLVLIIVKITCYFLPILVISITFWLKKEGGVDSKLDEDDEQVFIKNLGFNIKDAKSCASSSSEAVGSMQPQFV